MTKQNMSCRQRPLFHTALLMLLIPLVFSLFIHSSSSSSSSSISGIASSSSSSSRKQSQQWKEIRNLVHVEAIFQDQAGLTDWKRMQVGMIQQALLVDKEKSDKDRERDQDYWKKKKPSGKDKDKDKDKDKGKEQGEMEESNSSSSSMTNRLVIVGTNKNILAALDGENGKVVWRRVLPEFEDMISTTDSVNSVNGNAELSCNASSSAATCDADSYASPNSSSPSPSPLSTFNKGISVIRAQPSKKPKHLLTSSANGHIVRLWKHKSGRLVWNTDLAEAIDDDDNDDGGGGGGALKATLLKSSTLEPSRNSLSKVDARYLNKDLNEDKEPDMLVSTSTGIVALLSGRDGKVLWHWDTLRLKDRIGISLPGEQSGVAAVSVTIAVQNVAFSPASRTVLVSLKTYSSSAESSSRSSEIDSHIQTVILDAETGQLSNAVTPEKLQGTLCLNEGLLLSMERAHDGQSASVRVHDVRSLSVHLGENGEQEDGKMGEEVKKPSDEIHLSGKASGFCASGCVISTQNFDPLSNVPCLSHSVVLVTTNNGGALLHIFVEADQSPKSGQIQVKLIHEFQGKLSPQDLDKLDATFGVNEKNNAGTMVRFILPDVSSGTIGFTKTTTTATGRTSKLMQPIFGSSLLENEIKARGPIRNIAFLASGGSGDEGEGEGEGVTNQDQGNIFVCITFEDASSGILRAPLNNKQQQQQQQQQDVNMQGASWAWFREEALAEVIEAQSVEHAPKHLEGDADIARALEDGGPGQAVLARWKHLVASLVHSLKESQANLLTSVPRFVPFVASKLSELVLSWAQRAGLVQQRRTSKRNQQGDGAPGSDSVLELSDSEKEFFGFNRVLLLMTSASKLFALHSDTSEIMWSKSFALTGSTGGTGKNGQGSVSPRIFVTRDREMGPDHPPEVMVLTRDGDAMWINAMTGEVLLKEHVQLTKGPIVQVALVDPGPLFKSHEDAHRKVGVAVDRDLNTFLLPDTQEARDIALKQVDKLHLFFADASSFSNGTTRNLDPLNQNDNLDIVGVSFQSSAQDSTQGDTVRGVNIIKAVYSWGISYPAGSSLAGIATVDPKERVAAPAVVLGDQRLLIKHINPHLVGIAVLLPNNYGLRVTLVNVATGTVMKVLSHKFGVGPVQMARFENWLVYSYVDKRYARTEVSSVLITDGVINKWGLNPFRTPRTLGGGGAVTSTSSSGGYNAEAFEEDYLFSGFAVDPDVLTFAQQTFTLPFKVRALSPTVTRLGISSKSLIFALDTGQIVSIDSRFLDPRRPSEPPSETEKQEGLFQYSPALPIIPTKVVSYHQVIEGVHMLKTMPAKLESTSLLLACGLDLFYARTTPSKTFDVLAEDFNYMLLVSITLGLLIAVLFMKKLVERRKLMMSWQ